MEILLLFDLAVEYDDKTWELSEGTLLKVVRADEHELWGKRYWVVTPDGVRVPIMEDECEEV